MNFVFVTLPIHLETCGAFPIKGEMDWITLSPKNLAPPIEENLTLADEFKIIVEDNHEYSTLGDSNRFYKFGVPTWLHPEWSCSKDHSVLTSITQWIKDQGPPYRAGFQIHKLFHADTIDQRSKPEAALCAEPKK